MISLLISSFPTWAKIIIWILVLAVIALACAVFLFPWLQPMLLPNPDVTVGGG